MRSERNRFKTIRIASRTFAMAGFAQLAAVPVAVADEPAVIQIVDRSSMSATEPNFSKIDVDALTVESDFSVFMKPECPHELRLNALKKLWRVLPASQISENTGF